MKSFNPILPLSLLLMLLVMSCKQDSIKPVSGGGTAPGPIKNARVQNTSGGAVISFTLPDATDLLYVKAEYDLHGAKMEARTSFYKNELQVEGYGDTNEHSVTLYAVSRSEKASEPVKVTIKPLTPPVITIRQSLDISETFGGILARFKNPDAANVVIKVLLQDDVKKEWVNINSFYTSLDSGKFFTRGLPPVLQKFGIYVKDKFGNFSDTLITFKTPVYEEQLDKSKWADMRKKNYPIPQYAPLPLSGVALGEPTDYNSTYVLKNIWDGNTTTMFHTKEKFDLPFWLPIDLGVKAVLSRYKLWQRPQTYSFDHGNPHKWEIWAPMILPRQTAG